MSTETRHHASGLQASGTAQEYSRNRSTFNRGVTRRVGLLEFANEKRPTTCSCVCRMNGWMVKPTRIVHHLHADAASRCTTQVSKYPNWCTLVVACQLRWRWFLCLIFERYILRPLSTSDPGAWYVLSYEFDGARPLLKTFLKLSTIRRTRLTLCNGPLSSPSPWPVIVPIVARRQLMMDLK